MPTMFSFCKHSLISSSIILNFLIWKIFLHLDLSVSVPQTGGWDASILLGAAVYMLAGLLYLATVTTEVQEWNDYDEILDSDDSE